MKNKFLLATVSILSAVALVACSTPKKESRKPLSSESSSTEVVKKSKKSSSKKTSSKVESKSSDDTKSSVETKRVGSPDYGVNMLPCIRFPKGYLLFFYGFLCMTPPLM